MVENTTTIKRWSFEYFYMIIMVVYMSQMTVATNRLVGGYTGDILPLLIPIVPTIILFNKYKASVNNKHFFKLVVIYLVWFVAVLFKYNTFNSPGFISFHLFVVLSFFLAYTHVIVFGTAFSNIFEDVIVKFALISIPLWLFSLLPVSHSFFRLFPVAAEGTSAAGTNLFYVYHWLDEAASIMESSMSIPRNSGMSWEPGRYSVILCIAICNNLSNNGIKFKGNKNIFILLIALITTFSTTGYSIAACLYAIFYLKDFSLMSILKGAFVIVPALWLLMSLDFMGEKLMEKNNIQAEMEKFYTQEGYWSHHGGQEYHISLDRGVSLAFEYENIKHDPILGYSRNTGNSWFAQSFSSDYSLTGGLLRTFGQFGILLGLFFYYLMLKSSRLFASNKQVKRDYALMLTLLLGSVSYALFGSVIFMTFWLLGAFGNVPDRVFEK